MLNHGFARGSTQDKISFPPIVGVMAEISIHDQSVNLTVTNGSSATQQTIQIETEKALKISTEDYNFDGVQDFAISHLDDGMGTYTIYQIYVFSAKNRKFEVLQPKCGDEFINVSISRKNRTLINSYFSGNQMKTCSIKF
jgi:hypothetical protein